MNKINGSKIDDIKNIEKHLNSLNSHLHKGENYKMNKNFNIANYNLDLIKCLQNDSGIYFILDPTKAIHDKKNTEVYDIFIPENSEGVSLHVQKINEEYKCIGVNITKKGIDINTGTRIFNTKIADWLEQLFHFNKTLSVNNNKTSNNTNNSNNNSSSSNCNRLKLVNTSNSVTTESSSINPCTATVINSNSNTNSCNSSNNNSSNSNNNNSNSNSNSNNNNNSNNSNNSNCNNNNNCSNNSNCNNKNTSVAVNFTNSSGNSSNNNTNSSSSNNNNNNNTTHNSVVLNGSNLTNNSKFGSYNNNIRNASSGMQQTSITNLVKNTKNNFDNFENNENYNSVMCNKKNNKIVNQSNCNLNQTLGTSNVVTHIVPSTNLSSTQSKDTSSLSVHPHLQQMQNTKQIRLNKMNNNTHSHNKSHLLPYHNVNYEDKNSKLYNNTNGNNLNNNKNITSSNSGTTQVPANVNSEMIKNNKLGCTNRQKNMNHHMHNHQHNSEIYSAHNSHPSNHIYNNNNNNNNNSSNNNNNNSNNNSNSNNNNNNNNNINNNSNNSGNSNNNGNNNNMNHSNSHSSHSHKSQQSYNENFGYRPTLFNLLEVLANHNITTPDQRVCIRGIVTDFLNNELPHGKIYAYIGAVVGHDILHDIIRKLEKDPNRNVVPDASGLARIEAAFGLSKSSYDFMNHNSNNSSVSNIPNVLFNHHNLNSALLNNHIYSSILSNVANSNLGNHSHSHNHNHNHNLNHNVNNNGNISNNNNHNNSSNNNHNNNISLNNDRLSMEAEKFLSSGKTAAEISNILEYAKNDKFAHSCNNLLNLNKKKNLNLNNMNNMNNVNNMNGMNSMNSMNNLLNLRGDNVFGGNNNNNNSINNNNMNNINGFNGLNGLSSLSDLNNMVNGMNNNNNKGVLSAHEYLCASRNLNMHCNNLNRSNISDDEEELMKVIKKNIETYKMNNIKNILISSVFGRIKWLKIMNESPHAYLYGHSIVKFGNKLYMFGGSNSKHKKVPFNHTLTFSLIYYNYKLLPLGGNYPEERDGHTTHLISLKNGLSVFLFGGSNENIYYNDIYILDMETRKWSQRITKGKIPLPRDQHCSIVYPAKSEHLRGEKSNLTEGVIIFGGKCLYNNNIVNLNDMWIFLFQLNTWIRINYLSEEIPIGRYGMNLVWSDTNTLCLFGGEYFDASKNIKERKLLDDMWVFKLHSSAMTNGTGSNNNLMSNWNMCRNFFYNNSSSMEGTLYNPIDMIQTDAYSSQQGNRNYYHSNNSIEKNTYES
ncbi:conserved Plasmodium protein, unknown function, partial [Plasmodium malariae]